MRVNDIDGGFPKKKEAVTKHEWDYARSNYPIIEEQSKTEFSIKKNHWQGRLPFTHRIKKTKEYVPKDEFKLSHRGEERLNDSTTYDESFTSEKRRYNEKVRIEEQRVTEKLLPKTSRTFDKTKKAIGHHSWNSVPHLAHQSVATPKSKRVEAGRYISANNTPERLQPIPSTRAQRLSKFNWASGSLAHIGEEPPILPQRRL